jgi:hypothetical protein
MTGVRTVNVVVRLLAMPLTVTFTAPLEPEVGTVAVIRLSVHELTVAVNPLTVSELEP